MVKRKTKIDLFTFLVCLTVFDLVFGGSGRVIAFGPISFRIVLFACLLLLFVLLGRISDNTSNVLILLICLYWFVEAALSLLFNPTGQVIAELKGYIPIILCPVFVWYFKKYKQGTALVLRLFRIFIRLLALFQIAIWTYAFIKGISAYDRITGLLYKFDYGLFTFIDSANTIPRLFFKTSIFIFIGMLFELSDVFKRKKRMKYSVLFAVIETVAFITTFTLGFWLAAAISLAAIFLLSKKKKKLSYRTIFLIIASIVIVAVLFVRFDIYQMFMLRLESGSVEHKSSQFEKLLSLWLSRPIFGYGFGCTTYYPVDGVLVERYMFENVWMQILFHNGIVGLLLLLSAIVYTCVNLQRLYKKRGDVYFLILEVGLIYICIVSLFNPFINNSIGMVYFAICVGVSNIGKTERYRVKNGLTADGKRLPLTYCGEMK